MPKKRIVQKKAKQDANQSAFSVLQRVIQKTEAPPAQMKPTAPKKAVSR